MRELDPGIGGGEAPGDGHGGIAASLPGGDCARLRARAATGSIADAAPLFKSAVMEH
jgi:hypothetical protein